MGIVNNKKQNTMRIQTKKIETRFMSGNLDVNQEIFDIMVEYHGQYEVCMNGFEMDNAIYSNGFINAVEDGKIPMLTLHSTLTRSEGNLTEYHHVIINDECYNVFFTELIEA